MSEALALQRTGSGDLGEILLRTTQLTEEQLDAARESKLANGGEFLFSGGGGFAQRYVNADC